MGRDCISAGIDQECDMYQFRKKATPTNITLPKQVTTPSYGDLEFLVGRAMQNRGRYVELPFGEESARNTFVLTVKYIPEAGAPVWTLYRGEGPESVLAWSHSSHDLVLMHSLILSEAAGGQITESSHQDATFTSATLAQQFAEQAIAAGQELAPETVPAPAEPVEAPPSPAPAKPVEAPPSPAPVTEKRLEGNLRNIKIPKLLEHIAENHLAGRLTLQGGMGAAELFFRNGVPQHASTLDNKGEVALFEIVTWDEGEFQFQHNEQTSQNTVNRPLEDILAAASDLYDRSRFLAAAGLNQDSYLAKSEDQLSEVDVDMLTSQSASLDAQALRSLLDAMDGRHTLGDILRKRPMVRPEWISLVYSLLKYGMVSLVHKAPVAPLDLEPMELDEESIRNVLATLTDPESGIVTYSAFLYFLQQEFFRYERIGGRFALMVAEISMREGDAGSPAEPLPKSALREFGKYISTVKRKIDLFAHFEGSDLVLLMPDTDAAGASVLANRIAEALNMVTADAAGRLQLELAFGTACLPEDCRDPGMLLAAAREARRRARTIPSRVLMFADIGRA